MNTGNLTKWLDELQGQIDRIKIKISAIKTSLVSLTDVTITEPANGDIITYDSTAEKWKNSANEKSLASLTDVVITEPTDGQPIVYDATSEKFVNGSVHGYTVTELFKSETGNGVYDGTNGIALTDDIADYDDFVIETGFTNAVAGNDLSKGFSRYSAKQFATEFAYVSASNANPHALVMLWNLQGFSAAWDGANNKIMMWGQNGTAGIYAVYGIKY